MLKSSITVLNELFIVCGWDLSTQTTKLFVGLAYQAKDIVFRFIIKYSSLRDFGP
jgi:hypothetical protein